MSEKFIGIQTGPTSLYDEGIGNALDLMQDTAGVNAVIAYAHCYYGAHKRPLDLLSPDHGNTVRDESARNLPNSWIHNHEEAFRGTGLRHKRSGPDTEYWDKDILADLAEPTRKRGMKLYARLMEPFQARSMEYFDNWSSVLSIDVYGRLHSNTCFNNPQYMQFWRSTVEDLFKTYPIDGAKYGSERCGPLSRMLFWDDVPTCFCNHCVAKAKTRGINAERAQTGFRLLYEYNLGLKDGSVDPVDGAFTGFLRIILKYPEILAWENMFNEAKEDLAKQLYGVTKIVRPDAEFGIHVDHQQSTWDLFQRAALDYSEMARYCDWVKPIAYHDVAPPRIRDWYLGKAHATILRETSMETMLESFYDIMGYDKHVEPSLDNMDTRGLSEDYVYRLTKRLVDGVDGKVPIYPGIGFDLAYNGKHLPADPDKVYRMVVKAFEAGAGGIMLSREYVEMRIANLKAVGRALRDIG